MPLLPQVASSHTSSASSSGQGGVNAEELVQKMKLLTSGVREFTWYLINSYHYKFRVVKFKYLGSKLIRQSGEFVFGFTGLNLSN